jgi:eukaryotic-like serine/threonine-protein kinase
MNDAVSVHTAITLWGPMRTWRGKHRFCPRGLASSALLALGVAAGPIATAHASGGLSMTGFSPSSGPVGTRVTITGSGFVSHDIVSFNGTQTRASKASSGGTVLKVAEPALASSGPITVTDPTSGQTAGLPGTAFQVTTGLLAAPKRVWPGERITVAGSALTPDIGAEVTLGSVVLGDVRTDAAGDFRAQYTVPWITAPGHNRIAVEDPNLGPIIQPIIILSSWPQTGATPARTGSPAGEQLLGPSNLGSLTQKFYVGFSTDVGSGPVVAGGLALIAHDDYLTAVNAKSGALAWSFTAGDQIDTTPAVDTGMVFVSSLDGNLYGLNASNGAFVWRVPFIDSFSSPLANKGVVYFGTESGFFYALGASDGHFIWDFQAGAAIRSAPSIAKGIVYFGSDDDYVYALHAATGKLDWKYKTCNAAECHANEQPIAVSGGVAVVPSGDGFLEAHNASTGAYMWSTSEGTVDLADPVAVANGVVYLAALDNNTVKALNLSDGSMLWSRPCTGPRAAAYANGVVYVPCYQELDAFNASSGATLYALTLAGGNNFRFYSPAIAGGMLYYAATDSSNTARLVGLGT